MCSTDYDAAELFNQIRVNRSRRARKCYECDLPIPAGAPYIKTFMVFEGDPGTYAVHVECDAIAEFVRDEICRVEHEQEQARKKPGSYVDHFAGVILMGGLGEEISSLSEYTWDVTDDDATDARAMGFDIDDDRADGGSLTATPAQVAEWIWDVARDSYRVTP